MWRAFFCAIGISLMLIGGECLVVEKAVLATGPKPASGSSPYLFAPGPGTTTSQEFRPPEWAPWSLLSAGAVIVLYTLTIQKGK